MIDVDGNLYALEKYLAERDEKISALLSDARYDSKDWRQADLAGRIEWLIFMLKAKGEEVENMVRLAEPMLSDALAAAEKHIEELEGQLQSVLDRETSILRYYDAKLDAADAKLAKAVKLLKALDATLDRLGWHVDSIAREDIRTTLAKLKGQDDE